MLKRLAVAAFLPIVWLWATPTTYAQDSDKTTRITVNQPFEIPGMILPAGTYVMKIVDLAAERHVVRFLSADESIVYATLIGIPDFRMQPMDNSAITFYKSEFNTPSALHIWFYPGYRYGLEFAYPRVRALEIARVIEEPVIAFEEPEFFFHQAPGEVQLQELLREPLIGISPGGGEVAIAEMPNRNLRR